MIARLGLAGAALLCTLVLPGRTLAVEPDEILKDPELESRARALSAELRCMVCQNQSIDDSDAPLARDLRVLLRDRLKAGDTDEQVLDYLVARYGEFILLRPRFGPHTVILWFGPPLVLVGAGLSIWAAARAARRGQAGELPQLTAEERAAVEDLLAERRQHRSPGATSMEG